MEDREIGVGGFPEGEELVVLGAGFGFVAAESVGAGKAEVR